MEGSLKIVLILVTILSLISTFSLATEADASSTPVTTSEDTATTNTTVEGDATTEGTATENLPTTDDATTGGTTSTEASTNHDLYLIQAEVKITDAETVNGNAFIIADTITINGQIGGDLFVMANTLNIDGGQIYGNVFALAENITLNGLIYDLYGMCDTLTMSYDGVAYRDLKVSCDTATINGVVAKDVNIDTNSLSLESDCLIYGDLNYSAPNEIQIAERLVTGKVNYEKASFGGNTTVMDYVVSLLTALVYTLVVWFLLSKLAPKFYGKVTEMKPTKMLLALLVGLITLIVIPVVAMLLMVTVVGVPVAFALLAIYAIVISIAFALTSIVLATKVAAKVRALAKFNNIFAVIIVAIVLWALTLIPYAGGIISFLITLCGLGMFVLAFKKEKPKQIAAPAETAE